MNADAEGMITNKCVRGSNAEHLEVAGFPQQETSYRHQRDHLNGRKKMSAMLPKILQLCFYWFLIVCSFVLRGELLRWTSETLNEYRKEIGMNEISEASEIGKTRKHVKT